MADSSVHDERSGTWVGAWKGFRSFYWWHRQVWQSKVQDCNVAFVKAWLKSLWYAQQIWTTIIRQSRSIFWE